MTNASRRLVVSAVAFIAAIALGAVMAFAAGETTDTNVSCATATLPAHTIGVDGSSVATIAGMSTSQCNTVTYTVPTVTQTVTGSTTSSTTSSTTTSSTTTDPPATSVPAAPAGPATPAGGWAVQYADSFNACLADTATNCTLGAARQDDTLGSVTNKNGAGNSNEIDAAVPSEVDVTSDGLVLGCEHKAALGDAYSCGFVSDGAHNSIAPGGFHWTPSSSLNLVLEADIQLPANQGNMDPSFWVNGPNDNPEVDNPEAWGMNHVPPSGAANSWCGFQFGDPAVPFDSGGAVGNLQFTFCQAPVPNIDPSVGLHKWTLQEAGLTFTSYLDGVKLGSKTYSGFNGAGAAFKLLLENSMRQDPPASGPRDGYPFPANGDRMIVRYVAAYEPASAMGAGSNGPIIVPGTSIR